MREKADSVTFGDLAVSVLDGFMACRRMQGNIFVDSEGASGGHHGKLNGRSAFLLTRQCQVEQDPQNSRKTDAAQCEFPKRRAPCHRCRRPGSGPRWSEVAGLREVFAGLHQGVETDDGDGAEEQQHDAAHHRYRDGLQQGAHLADEGQGRMAKMAAQVMMPGLNIRVRVTAPVTSE
jgi:hypothetical protein